MRLLLVALAALILLAVALLATGTLDRSSRNAVESRDESLESALDSGSDTTDFDVETGSKPVGSSASSENLDQPNEQAENDESGNAAPVAQPGQPTGEPASTSP